MSAALKLKTNPNYQWNRRVLVVDDEKEIANSYKDILVPEGDNVVMMKRSSRSSRSNSTSDPNASGAAHQDFCFKVDIANSANEALQLVKKAILDGEPYSMGFFDVKLGVGLDGVELVREIYKMDPDMFAVFVTAHNDRSIENIQNTLGSERANQWDYLSKPFIMGEIIQKARNFTALWNLQKQQVAHEEEMQGMRERLLQNERMNSVAAVSRGVGHEFGNILMQIVGKAELSLEKDEAGKTQALEKVLDAAQRAMEILDKFKDLTDNGDVSVHKENQNLLDLISGTLDLMEHQVKMSELSVDVNVDENLEVFGNQTSIMQVFLNITINALHAMGKNGKINIKAEPSNDEYIVVTVRDFGPGIPEDILEKVVQPLFTTKGDKGTGLGLAICKEIVEIEHQGKFVVQNASGKGLEVVMHWPTKNSKGVV